MASDDSSSSTRVQELLTHDSMMVFMTGTPFKPQSRGCKELIAVCRASDVTKFSFFDVLTDDEVRLGLSSLYTTHTSGGGAAHAEDNEGAKYPEFPMVYINGVYKGGLAYMRAVGQDQSRLDTEIPKDCVATAEEKERARQRALARAIAKQQTGAGGCCGGAGRAGGCCRDKPSTSTSSDVDVDKTGAGGCGGGESTGSRSTATGGCCGGANAAAKKNPNCCGGNSKKDPNATSTACAGGCSSGKGSEKGGGSTEKKKVQEEFVVTDELRARLNRLVNKQPVVLFIKGTRKKPYCKFSKRLMALLREHNVCRFGYFNIFDDKDVRAGLKIVHQWKTYPQIYVKGQLLGGLDTIKELLTSPSPSTSTSTSELFAFLSSYSVQQGFNPRAVQCIDTQGVVLVTDGGDKDNADAGADTDADACEGVLKAIGCQYSVVDINTIGTDEQKADAPSSPPSTAEAGVSVTSEVKTCSVRETLSMYYSPPSSSSSPSPSPSPSPSSSSSFPLLLVDGRLIARGNSIASLHEKKELMWLQNYK